MKKKLFGGLLILVILCAAVQGTVAYFTASKVTHNVITTGNINIELVETKADGKGGEETYPTDPVEGIMPGQDHSKIVRVHNTGDNPAWVRIRVDVEVRGESGDDLGADSLSINYHTLESDKWTYRDGYYYYEDVLAPGAKTEELFDTVTFHTSMDNAYQNATITINVQAEGIQYENNTDFANAWPKGVSILAFK